MEEIFSFERASSSKSAVAMARRIHLFPCRTQQLSFLTPKVVGGKLPARIGSCRAKQESDGSLALFLLGYLRNALTLANKYYKVKLTIKSRVISRASEWLHTLT